jgi:hypothetical protein
LEFGFFSQTLYCIKIFAYNRDQGLATFLTDNLYDKIAKAGKYIILENFILKQQYRVWYFVTRSLFNQMHTTILIPKL